MAGPRPAHQRLGADDRPRGDVDLRLIVDRKPAALRRRAQVVFHRTAAEQARVHLRGEEAEAAPAVRFRAIERNVGLFGQLCRADIRPADRDPNTQADEHLLTVERYRFSRRRDQTGRERNGIVRQSGARLDDCKLVAANARQGVALAQAGAQAGGDRPQQRVAGTA